MLVMKFGGTSVGDAKCFVNVKDIVGRTVKDRSPVVVVVSAMSMVTEMLLEAARAAERGDSQTMEKKLQNLWFKHISVVDTLFTGDRRDNICLKVRRIISELGEFYKGIGHIRLCPAQTLDSVVSAGERLSSMLLAAYLEDQGIYSQAIDSSQCMITDGDFGKAKPFMDITRDAMRRVLLPLTDKGCVPVMTGFLGGTHDGVRTTLGRGGSDYSAAIVAASLDAKELWIWTDVDGVLSADPKVVEEAVILDELTYEEASELSHFGAKVLHHKTLRPLIKPKIFVYIKNTFAPEIPGTRIRGAHNGSPQGPKSVTSMAPVTLLTLRSNGELGTTELLARALSALSQSNVEILMVTQSSYQNSFCLLVSQEMAECAKAALEKAFSLELQHGYMQPLEVQPVAVVALIGEGMRGTSGVTGRLFGALGKQKISIIAIAQGSSESNISLAVSLEYREAAVRAIHQEFIPPAAT